MIDPEIISFNIGNLTIALRWYGLILMGAVMVGAWITDREFQRRGGDAEFVWDALIYVIPAGVVGSRLWYVLNTTLGGSRYFIENPVKIFNIPEGGLHIFGAIVFGGLVAYWYAKRHKIDMLMILDSIAPTLLISQALARPANYINQELYGPPTDLPWGIKIDSFFRIPPWNDLTLYPLETTRFHPTFAYEMIWNLITGGVMLWYSRRYPDKLKPGALFATWLVSAGVGRFIIEYFRPDQPVIPGTAFSYSRLVAILMTIIGILWLLVRYEVIHLSFWSPGRQAYRRTKKRK
jgi:phosphatidylglycerol:prolipoprotein diacylglycerol transferase